MTRVFGLGGLVLAALLGAAWWAADPAVVTPSSAGPRAPSLMAAGSHPDVPAPPGPAVHVAALAVFQTGSLRGTDFPPWGVSRDGPMAPNRLLRDRFDHYLLAAHDTSPEALRALVEHQARAELGARVAPDVLALWDRYLRLQQHPFQQVARQGDLDSMTVALQERQQVRQALLGLHWARAFYADDEAALAAQIERSRHGTPVPRDEVAALLNPPAGTDREALHQQRVERFGADKAARLREIDDDQAAWTLRLAAARAELDRLRHDPSLSGLQREEATRRLVDAQFHGPSEQLRAASLLGL